MNVLDLFSGTGGFSEAFRQRGHKVIRIDNDPQFQSVPDTWIADVLDIDFFSPHAPAFDVIVASPPCQAFSLAATGTHMAAMSKCACGFDGMVKTHEHWDCVDCNNPRPVGKLWLEPRTEFGKLSVALVDKTLSLIRDLNPKFWWMENPNGGMIHFVPDSIPRVQITQCQYGENRQKLTNLWGKWPGRWDEGPNNLWGNVGGYGWEPRPRCKNGDPCHSAAPRGAKTGTQGIKGAVARAAIPYELSEEICIASEKGLDN